VNIDGVIMMWLTCVFDCLTCIALTKYSKHEHRLQAKAQQINKSTSQQVFELCETATALSTLPWLASRPMHHIILLLITT